MQRAQVRSLKPIRSFCLRGALTLAFILRRWHFGVQFSRSVVSDSLRPHESQHARPPCPSSAPRVHSDSCPLSRWCHPTISGGLVVKNSPADAGDMGSIPGLERSPGEGNGNPLQNSYLEFPQTEEPGGPQSMGSQRVGHDWVTELNWSTREVSISKL